MPPPPPPPPPLPPPMPALGGPPPPPGRPPAGNRGALMSDITKGTKLRKTVTDDRSAPIVAKSSAAPGGLSLPPAPPVPGTFKASGNIQPSISEVNQRRTNIDKINMSQEVGNSPQLAGLFAGGMPKLKKRDGGVDTGATGSIYSADADLTQSFTPKPPLMTAPRPPNGDSLKPISQNAVIMPSTVNIRKPGTTTVSNMTPAKGPPPPVGKKPPAPGSRKPSGLQAPPIISSIPPSTLPPPPQSAAPRPPTSTSPRQQQSVPPQTSTPSTNGVCQNLAMQAAIRAAEHSSSAPCLAPPSSTPKSYGTPSPPSLSQLSSRRPPPVPQSAKSNSVGSYSISSEVTVANTNQTPEASKRLIINDPRWKFRDESMLPKPREYLGRPKKYRAGRGSSVPLDLSAFH